jgi:hypothetical protein
LPLWKVWWLGGVPVLAAVAGFAVLADQAHAAGHRALGGALDLVRLLVYWEWLRLAWRCAPNTAWRGWTVAARAALAGGLLVHVLL